MEHSDRRYSEGDVSEIVRRALLRDSGTDTISHEELLDIASQSGISKDRLEAAIEEQESRGELEAAKALFLGRRRESFHSHLRSYLIVIGLLLVINLLTSRGYIWAVWPAVGWGFGLAFDASDSFFVSDDRVERGARKILAREKRRKAKG